MANPVVKPCAKDPCAAGWAKVQKEVAQTDAITDIRQRNRVISASYARLYQASPDLKWAGAAAFASKQVGCGMDTAHTYLDDYPGGLQQATQDTAKAGGGGVDPITLTMYSSRQALGDGNKGVYDELYPPLRFYQENKGTMSKAQIMACLDHKPGAPLHPDIRTGIQQTMDGQGARGAITMLHHEQADTLQSMYDDNWALRRGLDVARLTGIPATKLVMTADCGGADALHTVDFKNYGSRLTDRLYNFDDRWKFTQDAAGRFVQLTDSPATKPGIDQALNQIAHAGGR